MKNFDWKKAIETTGNITEIAVKTGIVASNPILAGIVLGGKMIGSMVDDENDTQEYLNQLTNEQLFNLEKSLILEIRKRHG